MHDHTPHTDKVFLQCETVRAVASKIFSQIACCSNRIYTATTQSDTWILIKDFYLVIYISLDLLISLFI